MIKPKTHRLDAVGGVETERLERRQMLAIDAAISGRTLAIAGNDDPQSVVLSYTYQVANGAIVALKSLTAVDQYDDAQYDPGYVPLTFDANAFDRVRVALGGGDDSFSSIFLFVDAAGNDATFTGTFAANGVAQRPLTVDAGAGADVLTGGPFADTLIGGVGDDTIETGGNADSIDAGDGDDLVTIDLSTNVGGSGQLAVIPSDAVVSVSGGLGNDYIASSTSQTNTPAMHVNADAGNDTVVGSDFADTIDASDGDDSIDGAGGDDAIDGGAGNDLLLGGTGLNTLLGGAGDDVLRNDKPNPQYFDPVPDGPLVADGGAGNDSIFGDAFADSIDAGDGNDYISGGSGDDTLLGGSGNDTLTGGAGRNRLFGGDGSDRLNGSNGRDFLYGQDGDDRLYGQGGNDQLDGGGGKDRLYGGDGDDVLLGGASVDHLYGDAGDDTLVGGKSNDYLFGGDDADTDSSRDAGDILDSIEK